MVKEGRRKRARTRVFLAGMIGVGISAAVGGCKSPSRADSFAFEQVSVPIGVTTELASDQTGNRLVDFQQDKPRTETPAEVVPPGPAATMGTLAATDDVTVDDYVSLALAAHPRIQAARLKVSAAIARVPQLRALPDPSFSNTFWPIQDLATQTAGGRLGNQMSLSQRIPWPEKLTAQAAAATKEIQIAQAEVESVERQIIESVRLAYYELWFTDQAILIVNENRELVEELVTIAEARYSTGGRQSDVARAELEVDKLAEQLIKLQGQKSMAQADLAALLHQDGLMPNAGPELDVTLLPTELDQLIARAEADNPSLRGLAWQIQRDRQQRQVACLEKYPDLQLGIGWALISTDNAISPVANGRDNLGFTVGVTLPIRREKINAGIREADAIERSSVQLHQATRDELFGKVRRLYAQAESYTQQLSLYQEKIIPRTNRTLKFAAADYRGKRADFFDVIDIYQELLMHQLQVARIQATLAGTIAQLERVAGQH
jgi:outer membrane protein TolC